MCLEIKDIMRHQLRNNSQVNTIQMTPSFICIDRNLILKISQENTLNIRVKALLIIETLHILSIYITIRYNYIDHLSLYNMYKFLLGLN